MINSRLYVLNTSMMPVPPGVEGELFIAGAGVARGYIGDPRQTAVRFVPDPFATTPGARMYRSGDAVRYRPDGQLDFLRRLDDQVKIRGNRIELHDIELTIESHPDVRQSAAIAVRGSDDKPALVAFIAVREGSALNPGELHQFLRERLPDYMVPSGITVLDRLPLGPTGKIDRKALSETPPKFFSRDSMPPRDEIERVLVDILTEVLHREKVGVRDSFFELGGHSLLATQVTSRIRRIFGVAFPLDKFFEGGSVESIAAHLRSTEASAGRTARIARLYEKAKSLSDEEKSRLLRSKDTLDAAPIFDGQ
jgi:acyl carrier protein